MDPHVLTDIKRGQWESCVCTYLTLPNSIYLVFPSISWRRQWHPTPVLLPGKFHGWRSLGGCSPWGRKESDTTERIHFHFSLSCIGEGNGNPLRYSCLENPMEGEAWWATVHGVAKSQTRLSDFTFTFFHFHALKYMLRVLGFGIK